MSCSLLLNVELCVPLYVCVCVGVCVRARGHMVQWFVQSISNRHIAG